MTPETYVEKALAGDYGERARAGAEAARADAVDHGYDTDPVRIAESFDAICEPTPIAVTVCSTYACGRSTERTVPVPAPAAAVGPSQWLADLLGELGGDGHACGSSEHALYEITVVDAPEHASLIGSYCQAEG